MIRAAHKLQKIINLQEHEFPALGYSFLYFFCLLCAYYILRPIRDEMGIIGGIENLPWVFSGTFIAILAMMPLYGWLCSRFKRSQFLPAVYLFFISHLILFYIFFKLQIAPATIAQAFFIWVSVFNLFIVSVFWSFMDDIYDKDQAKRLFGAIAAGGTTGAIAGPALTATLAHPLGTSQLLLISSAFLVVTLFCIQKISAWYEKQHHDKDNQSHRQPIGGHWLAGFTQIIQSPYLIGIALLILLFTTLSTFLYFEQASIIKSSFISSEQRTTVFAMIDLAVNILTLVLQFFITSRLIKKIGLAWTLALIPGFLTLGFITLAIAPVLTVLVVVQVLRRAGNYAIMRPAREMLYVVLPREEKYKAKNFIDTVIYRGGDAASAWVYDGLRIVGLNLSQIALIAIPLATLWAIIAYRLGIKREQIASQQKE